MNARGALLLAIASSFAVAAQAQAPTVKKRRPLPQEFGRVVLDNHTQSGKLAPVVFDHWLHRARYTCRLCHVDVGFAMKARATDVRAEDNAKGQYCGACHDGRKLFAACDKDAAANPPATCSRCHSLGKGVRPDVEFADLVKGLPAGRFGNGVDWEKAERDGRITLVDHLDGLSIRRPRMPAQKDFALNPTLEGMPEIIFSHAKHTAWNGCESCHPDIFLGVKKGASRYTMVDIFEGRSCGACHLTVAFPLQDCQRCHSRPVMPASGGR